MSINVLLLVFVMCRCKNKDESSYCLNELLLAFSTNANSELEAGAPHEVT